MSLLYNAAVQILARRPNVIQPRLPHTAKSTRRPSVLDGSVPNSNWKVIGLALFLVTIGGCGGGDSIDPIPIQSQAASPSPQSEILTGATEQWDAILLDNQHAGYAHTLMQPLPSSPGETTLVGIEHTIKLRTNRFGDGSESGFQITATETSDGRPRRFTIESRLGQQPLRTECWVENKKLHVSPEGVPQKPEPIEISDDVLGVQGLEVSLRRQPLQAGQTRRIRAIDPQFSAVVEHQLAAQKLESTSLLDRSQRLLRIEQTTYLPGKVQLKFVLWTDEQGNILKRQSVGLATTLTMVATTRERAMQEGQSPALDLGLQSTVPVAQDVPDVHQRRTIRYHVRLREGNPALAFASTPLQVVRPLGDHAAEIVVSAFDWSLASTETASTRGAGPAPMSERVTGGDREPNRLVASDHPDIERMAQSVATNQTDPAAISLALERHVHRSMRQVNYNTVLASAGEVVQRMEGDCTEHAVLLAALARARGIPARAAVGLVYLPKLRGFAFHMWTEVHVAGRWLPLDATLGQSGIGPGHLKLLDTNFANSDGLTDLLPVAQALGQLEIQVTAVE